MMRDGTQETPPFQRIVVSRINLFSRSVEEWIECIEMLEANGVQVMSIKEGAEAT